MSDYSQPEFYRFNQDSTALIKWVQAAGLTTNSILDLGAGSGIIGIELGRLLKPATVTLVEVQKEFKPHLEDNCRYFLPSEVSSSIVMSSFADFKSREKFDLIVCNPPYYLPGKGEQPQNPLRAIARSFLIDSWEILLKQVSLLVSATGKILFILKNDEQLYHSILTQIPSELANKRHEMEGLMILELFRLDKN
ncbi:MAG: methyltransferase [Bdellovibrionales bacterium]|nr:methyltransferase [Bdellovibrionales bacterium]